MKKKIFISIIVLVIFIVGMLIFTKPNGFKSSLPSLTSKLIAPKYVSVFLASSVENIDVDWLEQSGDKEIIFKLGKLNNKYKFS